MKQLAVILIMLILSNMVKAQDFQGKATYKSHRKMDIELDSTQMETEMHKRMIAMMKKQFEKTYILSFDANESVYKEDEQLEDPQPEGLVMVVIEAGGSDVFYKNIPDNRFTSQSDLYGKMFLVKDKLRTIDWKLESETKNIGEYTCYKASFKREVPVVRGEISVNGDKDLDEETEPEMEEVTVTAWYTPQIPVNNGPGNYHGLPGLILEVNNGRETIICSKIEINPSETMNIKEPVKGKVVTQKEFDVISEKKAKEMRERYEHKRGDGHGMEIKIRG
jgi:GLPGLI family protein